MLQDMRKLESLMTLDKYKKETKASDKACQSCRSREHPELHKLETTDFFVGADQRIGPIQVGHAHNELPLGQE
jgi:hypothetical protein